MFSSKRRGIEIILLLAGLLLTQAALGAVFNVTSSSCSGPGSITEAIKLANDTPGLDTVSLTVDVINVHQGSCQINVTKASEEMFIAQVTDDLVIEGNGVTIFGNGFWVSPDGVTNSPGKCPADKDLQAAIMRQPLGLVRLTTGVDVTINNLKVRELRAIAFLDPQADLTLSNFRADKTFDFFGSCDEAPIQANGGSDQNITIKDSIFAEAWNDGDVFPYPNTAQVWLNAFILGLGSTGTLSISDTIFDNTSIPAIDWDGTANIENSQIERTGFVTTRGGDISIVNSILVDDPSSPQDRQARVMASRGGSISLEASTITTGILDCDSVCRSTTGLGLLVATTNATIELKGSAIGVGLPGLSSTIPPTILIREESGGNVTATGSPNPNWVQPVTDQNASQLRAILNQNALLTDAPGLPADFSLRSTVAYVTPLADDGAGTPGLLIDAVTGANTTNVLRSPIDGSPITVDVYGNPRTEAAGTVRNIGAVQLGLVPTLSLAGTGNGSVDLSWSRPKDPASGAVTGYEVCFGTGKLPDPTILGTDCEDGDGNPGTVQPIANAPDTLNGTVNGLTNGDLYWFLLRAVNPNPGLWSNLVSGTPMDVPGAVVLTATSGAGEVALSWTVPVDNSAAIDGYVIRYRPLQVPAPNWTVWPFVGTGTSTVVTGLVNEVPYEFSVNATNQVGSGPQTIAQATPALPLGLFYPSPVPISEGEPLSITPTFVNVIGNASYSLDSGSLPGGLSLDPATGVISGTVVGGTGSGLGTVYAVTVKLERSGPPQGTTTADLIIRVFDSAQNPQLNYLTYTGSAGHGPVSITPTVTGLTPPYTFSALEALPPGLTVAPATGIISGTPTTVGFWDVDMQVEDSTTAVQLDAVQITINPTLSYAAVTGELGTALNVSPVVSPSVVPGVFALTGTLPQGLSFNTATGAVTGTPTEVIATPLTVSLTVPEPSGDLVTSTALSIDIKSYPITFTYPDGAGEVGQPLTITPTVSGTKGAVTFSLLAQTPLPAGMTLDPGTGEISGTPTESGAFPVQVRVTDQYSTQSAAAAIRVQAPLPQPAAVPLLDRFELLLLAIATLFVGWVGLRRFCIRLGAT